MEEAIWLSVYCPFAITEMPFLNEKNAGVVEQHFPHTINGVT